MKLSRVMLAAPKSGSGKTTITCALLSALKSRGIPVVSYKCGPDYIDPLFHEQVLGVPSKNMDTFFTGAAQTRALFFGDRKPDEFLVVEGVMGLYDGLGGIFEEGSSYHLAQVTQTPIVLIVDAKGMGRSLLPLLAGFLAYDKEKLIQGVILNRISKASAERLQPLIEKELALRVLGFVPELPMLQLASRHLGLVLPQELTDLKKQLQLAGAQLKQTLALDMLCQIAAEASPFTQPAQAAFFQPQPALDLQPRIAVARDAAFCFYYEDNLRLLRAYGASLSFFSPLEAAALPEGCDALLFGGGYPELYAEKLSRNTSLHRALQAAFADGMPFVAECGGFMYLHETLTDQEGRSYPMAGVLPAVCDYRGRLVRFGYIELREKNSSFLPEGAHIRGHEFHYFDSSENGADCVAKKPATGRTYACVHSGAHYWLGFPHLYYPSNPQFAAQFVQKAAAYHQKRKTKL